VNYEDIMEFVAKLVGEGDEFTASVYQKSLDLAQYGVHPIDPSRGRMLELVARQRTPKRVLEIGSGAGYSALWFMKGMGQNGTLDAIERSPEVVKELRQVLRKANLEERVRIHHGNAIPILRNLKGPYDLVFIDADKEEYPIYLQEAMRLTKPGSLILADNMLWKGATIRGENDGEDARGISEYIQHIFHDPRLSSLIIPLGDGLAISSRISGVSTIEKTILL
jgi:predicted O-methyltransferase YrrM